MILLVVYAEGQWMWDLRGDEGTVMCGLADTEQAARWAGEAMRERLSRA